MGRKTIRIKGKADTALVKLSSKLKLSPQQLVEKLLISTQNQMIDNELCQKEYFLSSIVYQLELPFCFPYECERFDFSLEGINARLYLERIPKRYVIDRLPFRTLATTIMALSQEDEKLIRKEKPNVVKDNLHEKYSKKAFSFLKNLIITFRRITQDYYNIGVVEHPVNLEEFSRKVRMSIVHNNEDYSHATFMPIKEDSFISIAQSLEKQIHSEITETVKKELEGDILDFLHDPMNYFDAANVSFYQEKWNLSLLESVIAMESGLSHLVLDSDATNLFLRIRCETREELKKSYKEAPGLPKKIERFLFPIIENLNLPNIKSNLSELMPSIDNDETENGIYNLRSKVVHEGASVSETEAKKAIAISSQFLMILKTVNAKL